MSCSGEMAEPPRPPPSVRVPYLDFAPQFVDAIRRGSKRATARCPGGPKDTDLTSDFEAIVAQRWALATCSSWGPGRAGFAVLGVDAVETRAFHEDMNTGKELRDALQYFYPLLESEDKVSVVKFHVLHEIPCTESTDAS
eukprot:gnl/TRDRNA2_/TRDRNA2_168443_c0_seq4.p1 gnl/TRDRNA2_/TRDRNA2_168443_c0~~gnl/TRDRNA2_/TRDRNA2_168443_c0_seq4.p1  ORF type:complete len:140 (+),score=19.42 gnl/TRDRNA2_/TRDRNA2_168443_c0_seq4:60-479(+)